MSKVGEKKLSLEQQLVQSGERDRLKELLRQRLIENGWHDKVRDQCHEFIKNRNIDQVSMESLAKEITPEARRQSQPANNDKPTTIEMSELFCKCCTYRLSTSEKNVTIKLLEDQMNLHGENVLCCLECMGLFNNASLDRLTSQITVDFQRNPYDSTTFSLAMGFPVALTCRQFMVSKLNQVNKADDILSLREALKLVLAKRVEKTIGLRYVTTSEFSIAVDIEYANDQKECQIFKEKIAKHFLSKSTSSNDFTRIGVQNALEELHKIDTSINLPALDFGPFVESSEPCTFRVTFNREVLVFAGRYCKFSRHLNQTPWLADDGSSKCFDSVEELLCPLLTRTAMCIKTLEPNIEYSRFMASGREDVDVRMLGTGRPFALQILNPRRIHFSTSQLHDLEAEINGHTLDIRLCQLKIARSKHLKVLKQGEESKKKVYSASCWSKSPIDLERLNSLNEMKNVILKQLTPVRVLHRRALSERSKTIYDMKVHLVDPYHFMLIVSTQAGTYVKEFVHGDLGRTTPSLCDLLNTKIDILELDVLHVDLEWP